MSRICDVSTKSETSNAGVEKFVDTDAKNRYGDSKFVHSHLTNSWQLEIEDLDQGNSIIESVCSFK